MASTLIAHKAKLTIVILLLYITLSLSFERHAHAYVDPGSGLLILQSLSAVLSGVLFYLRRRIRSLFTRTRKVNLRSAPIVSSQRSEPR